MLKQAALVLAVVIVALLAIVAALTIVNRNSVDDEVIDSDPAELTGPRTTIVVPVGAGGGQVEIGCLLPVEGQSPLLVSFENRTGVLDDYQAQVEVRHSDSSTSTVVADAPELRAGERRTVLAEPWLEPEGITGCEVVAVQASDQVIILESD